MHKRIAKATERPTGPPTNATKMQSARFDRIGEITLSGWMSPLTARRNALMMVGAASLLFLSAMAVATDRSEHAHGGTQARSAPSGLRSGGEYIGSYGGYGSTGVYGSSGGYGSSGVMASETVSLAHTKSSASFGGSPAAVLRSKKKKNRSKGRSTSFEAADETEGGMAREKLTMGQSVLDALENQKTPDAAIAAARMIVREGEVQGKVPGSKLDSTAKQIASLVEDQTYGEGGFVARRSSSENEFGAYSLPGRKGGQKAQRTIGLDLRVPSGHFEALTETIQRIIEEVAPAEDERPEHKGKVTSLSTDGRDATSEFVDATARADTLDASRRAIQTLLSRADTVEDVMQIQRELNRLTQASEGHRRTALDLKNRSELSTLHVRLVEYQDEDTPADDDNAEPHGWRPTKSAALAIEHISVMLIFAFDTLAYSLVWAVPGIFIYFVGGFCCE